MSKGMKQLAVDSGRVSTFYKSGITGFVAQNTTHDLWELPAGVVIFDASLWYTTIDTTATADQVLESTEAAPRTFLTFDISAVSIIRLVQTAALLAPIAGTSAQRKLRLRNTAAGTGDGVYACLIHATRPGPEPQNAA